MRRCVVMHQGNWDKTMVPDKGYIFQYHNQVFSPFLWKGLLELSCLLRFSICNRRSFYYYIAYDISLVLALLSQRLMLLKFSLFSSILIELDTLQLYMYIDYTKMHNFLMLSMQTIFRYISKH